MPDKIVRSIALGAHPPPAPLEKRYVRYVCYAIVSVRLFQHPIRYVIRYVCYGACYAIRYKPPVIRYICYVLPLILLACSAGSACSGLIGDGEGRQIAEPLLVEVGAEVTAQICVAPMDLFGLDPIGPQSLGKSALV